MAFYQAVNDLRAGAAHIALARRELYHEDRLKFSAIFDGGWDVHETEAVAAAEAL